MNASAAAALVKAAMDGVPQIKGQLFSPNGGRCAMGVLWDAGLALRGRAGLDHEVAGCPECGATTQMWNAGDPINTERDLVVHLNNDHGWGFLDIASKLGPDASGSGA